MVLLTEIAGGASVMVFDTCRCFITTNYGLIMIKDYICQRVAVSCASVLLTEDGHAALGTRMIFAGKLMAGGLPILKSYKVSQKTK